MFKTSNFIIFCCRINSCAWQVLCLDLFDIRLSGDRAKVSGMAGEGILMIIACGWSRQDSPLGLFFTPQITALGVPKTHLITIDACKMFVCDRRH
ncbi:hypothetical protein QUA27_17650 [Microcoleus sp. Pol14C6]|uniref:hypothetical protein n=1 Tax=unclassified Microcoleus TaxID=2642155 RepID=UPI002FD36D20